MSNTLTDKNETAAKNFYRASAADFKKIPGSPIAYWGSEAWLDCFTGEKMADYLESEGAVKTGNNEKYIRCLWEVSSKNISISGKWRKHPKGGEYRKWYGNLESVVDWSEEARNHYKQDFIARIPVESVWNIKGITWTAVSSSSLSFRIENEDEIANNAALFIYPKSEEDLCALLCCLNACQSKTFLSAISPTLNYLIGDIFSIPYPKNSFNKQRAIIRGELLVGLSRYDWDFYETSFDFNRFRLLDDTSKLIENSYRVLREKWLSMTSEMQKLEEENNRVFIEAYGLQNELTPEVPLKEITLTCNPHYRYGGDKSEAELEALLLADTMREYISYAVGCMFGRYSVDEPGLILANQGETLEDYLRKVPEPRFMPDADNVIPLIDFEGDWFEDDISERFKQFLKVTFGEEHFQENLQFIEDALGKDIRKFFLKDFYNDHTKRYKKRPIYWLFSSPKGSFNALIYMHRYRPDTASVVLNDYLREFRTKLGARKESYEQTAISISASPADKAKALKSIEKIHKVLEEVNDYERDILYPLAGKNIAIDLDDGVKKNYLLFGNALKKIAGLDAKED